MCTGDANMSLYISHVGAEMKQGVLLIHHEEWLQGSIELDALPVYTVWL